MFRNRIRQLEGDEAQFISLCCCTDVGSLSVVGRLSIPTGPSRGDLNWGGVEGEIAE